MDNINDEIIDILVGLEIQNVNSFREEINSLIFIEMIVEIENRFDIEIDSDYFLIDKLSSLEDISRYIKMKKGEHKNE